MRRKKERSKQGQTNKQGKACMSFVQVLHNVGLCIALYDITYVGESYILPGDGASHTKGKIS